MRNTSFWAIPGETKNTRTFNFLGWGTVYESEIIIVSTVRSSVVATVSSGFSYLPCVLVTVPERRYNSPNFEILDFRKLSMNKK